MKIRSSGSIPQHYSLQQQKNKMEKKEEVICDHCGKKGDYEPHPCPALFDLDNECNLPEDQQTLCNCCENCTNECAMDV